MLRTVNYSWVEKKNENLKINEKEKSRKNETPLSSPTDSRGEGGKKKELIDFCNNEIKREKKSDQIFTTMGGS